MTREEFEKKYGYKPGVLTPGGRARAQVEVQKPQGSFLERAANKITDFVGARGIAEQYGTTIAASRAKTPEEKQMILNSGPSLKQVVGSAIQTGANFIPGVGAGASLTTKIATNAATGYVAGVGAKIQSGKSMGEAFTPGAETLIAAAIPVASKILGMAPKALEKANLRMTPTEQQQFASKGQDIAQWMADKKIVGTPAQRLSRMKVLYNEMEEKVQATLSKDGSAIPKERVIDEVRAIANDYADDPLILPEVEKAIQSFEDFLNKKNTYAIYVGDLNTYKRAYWERAFTKNKADVANEAKYAVGTAIKKILDKEVPGLAQVNKEFGPVIAARRILGKAASRNSLGLISRSLATGLGAAAGGTVGGFMGAGIGGIAGERIASVMATPIRSATGATLTTLGQVLQKLPVDEQGNIPVKLLIQALAGQEEENPQ